MALGRFHLNSTLDTASDPDDTAVLAAPGANQRIYVQWLHIIIVTGQASSTISVEDGAGGSVLANQASTAAGTTIYTYATTDDDEGLRLSENTALNVTIAGATGVVARVVGEAVVRGG